MSDINIVSKMQAQADRAVAMQQLAAEARRNNRHTGYWNMDCWNSLSEDQQRILMEVGCLPFGRKLPEGGTCSNVAECEVTTQYDLMPGPRFYCITCAAEYLAAVPT